MGQLEMEESCLQTHSTDYGLRWVPEVQPFALQVQLSTEGLAPMERMRHFYRVFFGGGRLGENRDRTPRLQCSVGGVWAQASILTGLPRRWY